MFGMVILHEIQNWFDHSLLVVLSTAIFVSQDSFRSLPPVESLMLGTEMDLQLVEGTVVALENSLKMWLHDQGGDREHLHLLLPPSLTLQGSTQHPANNRPSPGRNTHMDSARAPTKIFIRKSLSCCTQLQKLIF